MRLLSITLEVKCANEKMHEEITTLFKTVLHTLDMAVEGKHPGNDLTFHIAGGHPDGKTLGPSESEVNIQFGGTS